MITFKSNKIYNYKILFIYEFNITNRVIIYQEMNQWLSQTQFVENISKDLLRARQEYYSEDVYILRMQEHPQLHLRHLKVYNCYQEKLHTLLVDTRNKQSEHCIIYMHGSGSNTLEGSMLIQYLPENMALCCFDFSGSGKSQGNYSTFGIKEYRDLDSIIQILTNEGYSKFILWGRSMGAFASLAYSTTHTINNSCILQILDSPFNNFQSVCRQRAKSYYGFPQFIVNYSVNLLKNNMDNHPFNPFNMNLSDNVPLCRIPTVFVYNQHDDVIPSNNTQQLINSMSFKCIYQRLIIEDQHNCIRSHDTLNRIFAKISKYTNGSNGKRPQSSRKALIVCSSFFKKFGSSKFLSRTTDSASINLRHKPMIYCSLSKCRKKSPKQTPRKLKLARQPQRSFF